jgi:hypothetical protein
LPGVTQHCLKLCGKWSMLMLILSNMCSEPARCISQKRVWPMYVTYITGHVETNTLH